MTKAVIYARFSPRPDADKCQSIEVQLAACRAYCAGRGHTIVGEYSDREASGDDINREGLWAAVVAVPRGGVLVVAKLDRLARSVQLDGYIRVKLDRNKATVEAADGSTPDNSPEAVLMRQVLAAIAEYNKRITAARTKAAMLHAQASGRAMSERPPIGKRRVGKALVDDPAEQAAIKTAKRERQAGKSLRQIAATLNERHPARGKTWHATTVRSMLSR